MKQRQRRQSCLSWKSCTLPSVGSAQQDSAEEVCKQHSCRKNAARRKIGANGMSLGS